MRAQKRTGDPDCDGSVLLDSQGDNIAEKEAAPNLSLRGYEVIDSIKAELERECPKTVSCADILALATRDTGFISRAWKCSTHRKKGWPHGIGFCHCLFFVDRLYDFQGTGFPDLDVDPAILNSFKKKCPRPTSQNFNIRSDPRVFINQMSAASFTLHNSFYLSILVGRAVLQLDQELAFTDLNSKLSEKYAKRPGAFQRMIAKSMVKFGNVGVLTGRAGEIRRNCKRVNTRH
ncbi:hypothetical protein ACLOJK_039579 [Asimina triloba]